MKWVSCKIILLVCGFSFAWSDTGVSIDEDWTDGAFDHPNWRLENRPGQVGFMTVNADGSTALVHKVYHDRFTWGVAYLDHIPLIKPGADEVMIIRMETLSDVAYSSQQFAKPEIAALRLNPEAQFGHDYSAELTRFYSSTNGLQSLSPSVENNDNTHFRNAHGGVDTAASLGTWETSLTVFRSEGSYTNMEVFGDQARREYGLGDFNGKESPLLEYDAIQISMPREALKPPSHTNPLPELHRSQYAIDPNVPIEQAQIAMRRAHVGVTHRSDANLDYCTDAVDFMYALQHLGDSGTMMFQGDFNNDGQTDAADLALWAGKAGQLHDDDYSGSAAHPSFDSLSDFPDAGLSVSFSYDAATGSLSCDTAGHHVVAVVLETPATLTQLSPGGAWWMGFVRGKAQWADSSRGGFTGVQHLASFSPGLQAGNFGRVYYATSAGDLGSATLNVVGSGTTPYEAWIMGHGVSGTDAEPESILAGDGVSNLEKYIADEVPLLPLVDQPIQLGQHADGRAFFDLPADRSDIHVIGEWSSDLLHWSASPNRIQTDRQSLDAQTDRIFFEAGPSSQDAGLGFFRLRLELIRPQ